MSRVARSTTMSGGGKTTRISFPFSGLAIAACLWIVCSLATMTVSSQQEDPFYTNGRYGKREESYAQASPFFSGSRYGRGETTSVRGSKSESKMLEVSPRVDRFFLGSRYGKRGMSDDGNIVRQQQQQQQQQQQRELRQPSRLSWLKRFEEALGYFDRAQRADRVARTIDYSYEDNNSNNGIIRNNGNNQKIAIEIPYEDEPDNFW